MKNGILLIDKPEGITSYDVIRKLKKIFKTRKIGHAGTLDPFATGLLITAIGKATRILEYISSENKTYEFEMILGKSTDSFDITGKIIEEKDWSYVNEEILRETISEFTGDILQVPPVFSAKKMNGERLYEKARRGEIINIPPVKVKIYELSIEKIDFPLVKLKANVSKGTYIRSLVHDIGRKLGCGAVAKTLRRLSVGKFDVSKAIKLEDISYDTKLLAIDEVVDFPKIYVKNDFIDSVFNGQSPKAENVARTENFKKGELVKIMSENSEFIGIGIAKRNSSFIEKMKFLHPEEGVIKIKKIFKES
jgi:tRNA pseudouridine55 synthase